VYREANDESETQALGPWLLRKSDLLGKTTRQIKDQFALPYEPTHVVDIKLNAGFRFQAGTSGPNAFGSGGREQFLTLDQLRSEHLGPSRRLP